MFYRPLYADRIMAYADTPFVKILTGVRRCGKSTILKMIMEKLQQERDVPAIILSVSVFDSMEYDDMTAKEMYVFLKGQPLVQKEEPISFWMRCRKFDQRRWSAGNMNDFWSFMIITRSMFCARMNLPEGIIRESGVCTLLIFFSAGIID